MSHATALSAALDGWLDHARQLRRVTHADLQHSGHEASTPRPVLEALPSTFALTGVAETGAAVRLGALGAQVAVRAALDALAVAEQTGVPWASGTAGMHACGHDVHLAASVALARVIDSVPGSRPLLLLLQPREETPPFGAFDIIQSGILQSARGRRGRR